jgi:3-oxosteroid 1-dehydrogenase
MARPAETFDFVIVGSGGGSMCAALLVQAQGKKALILEKTDQFGGTTSRSGGMMWIPNNRFMAPEGAKDSAEQALEYMNAVIGDAPDVRASSQNRRMAYIAEAPKMIDFLVDQGIKLQRFGGWPDYYSDAPGGSEVGRSVIAELFDANELGANKAKLRPNYIPMPAKLGEAMKVPLSGVKPLNKLAMLKVGWRMITQKLLGKDYVSNGAALQGRMFKRAIEAGIDMRANSAVEELLTDASGAVTGVVALVDGVRTTFHARSGVLVNAGGFARNQAMRDKYMPGTNADWSNAIPGDTGEMIEEMIRLGAHVEMMDEFAGNQMALIPEKPEVHTMVMQELAKPYSIVVDQTGARYIREVQSYMQFCQEVYERNKVAPAVPSWLVMESRYIDRYMVAGTLPGSRKPQAWFDAGFLVKADTLAELAEKCGMNPSTLEDNVLRYNALARTGVDTDFRKGDRAYDRYFGDPTTGLPNPNMAPLEQGPYYAYKFYPGDIGTWGGVLTDANARVLREDGSVIPNLYATGTSAASFMGRKYLGPGASVGPSFTWGYVAAKHAMNAGNAAA